LTRKPCLHQAGQGLRSRISKREQSAAMGAKSATMQRAFILPGARADYHNTDTLKDEQVKSGQPGQQVGHSVPSQMLLNTNEAPQSNDAAAMQAWKDEISLFVSNSIISIQKNSTIYYSENIAISSIQFIVLNLRILHA